MSDEPHVNRVPDFSDLFLWNLTPVESARTGFHMPGHMNARSFDDEYARRLLLTDTTELSRTDDLHGPGGPVLHAAESLAKTYGSGQSFFITTGSTTGIRAMMAAVAHEKTFFLLPRAVHVSVLYTLVILGASYAFFSATIDNKEPSEPIRRITPEDVRAGLSLYPQTTDVLLVSPDYYGCCADLAAIASVVHDAGARLLVDEAHGAHLRFCPAGGPQDAMSSGVGSFAATWEILSRTYQRESRDAPGSRCSTHVLQHVLSRTPTAMPMADASKDTSFCPSYLPLLQRVA